MNAKRFARHHLACCISPEDMALLLPIWITSGSCFALIYPGTNDVPLAIPSRSRPSQQFCPVVIDVVLVLVLRRRRLTCIYIPSSFRLVAEVREPMESFLISDENASATSHESSQPATREVYPSSTDFISARSFYFFPLRKICDDSRLFLTETSLFKRQVISDTWEKFI